MSNTKTIRRNAVAKLRVIYGTSQDAKAFSLDNGFAGEAWAGEMTDFNLKVEELINGRAKLTTDGKGNYTVHVHSNLWYEFTAAAV